jgi:hypothetical protein
VSLRAVAAGLVLLLAAAGAVARPMGFKNSWLVMADGSRGWSEGVVNYAFTADDAVGIDAVRMRSDDGSTTRDLAELSYVRLLHRWNLPDAQANVWFFGGAGAVRGNDFAGSRTMLTPGLQVDYETTRVYASAMARLYRANGLAHDVASVRLGFSAFEADCDEVQPWFVVELRRTRGLTDKLEVTPMLRLIHNRYMFEAGVSNLGQPRANLMVVF